MGRYKTKRQAIEEANKRMLKEDPDEFKRHPGSMADSLWKSKHKEWEEENTDDGWQQLKRVLYDYEKKLDGKQLEEHIKNLKSHIQEVIYVLNNR